MLTYTAMRKSPDVTPVLGRSVRRSAAIRPIPVLDVHHPLERDAEVAASRAFDAPRATSTSHAGLSPVFLDPRELQLGPGVALSPSTRKPFEQRMGQSFSGVRVHVGLDAGALAERLHARALTHGRDIFFAQGEFRPETRSGRGLIAHELAHTLQPQARGGTAVIARFAAPGAAPPMLSEEARKWLDARSCVEPTSSQALALLAAFQRLPPAVQAEILAQYKVNTAANSARLAEDLKKRAAASTQRVIGADGLGGTITGTREFVESVQSLNQTSRGTAAVASNVLGAVGLGIGMGVFDDKQRQLSMGEFGAELGNILLTGPGTNKALGSRGAPRQDHAPVPQTIEIKSHVVSGVAPALTKPSQIKLGPAPGPKRVADDAGVQDRPKPATAPQAPLTTKDLAPLLGTDVRTRYGEIMKRVAAVEGQQARVEMFEALKPGMKQVSKHWEAFRMPSTDGSVVFEGLKGYMLVFRRSGAVLRGQLDSSWTYRRTGPTIFHKEYTHIPYKRLTPAVKDNP